MASMNQDNTSIINKTVKHRQHKLAKLRATGEVYPNNFRRTEWLADIVTRHDKQDKQSLQANPMLVRIAGRIMQRRIMGKVSFLDLQDMSGRLQIYLRESDLYFETAGTLQALDLGDIIGVEGYVFRTKTGELSVKGNKLWLLTKALQPLPDKFHGLQNTEMRYRQRYLDLLANPETREVFKLRVKLLKAIRSFFDKRDYLEVETPMMHPLVGGALAKPFTTHHNALDMPLYLRIAPELYLKRLVVGGFERVYEINRSFRNEGLSTRHNPEFTMVEFYEAYADYERLMDLTEALIRHVAQDTLGKLAIDYQGEHYDLSKPFDRLTMIEALLHYHPELKLSILQDRDQLQAWMASYKLDTTSVSLEKLQFMLFEETVEKQLRQPTFITAYPIEVSPLARRNSQNPKLADRFELYVGGRELANGFSELNDPVDQAERFAAQMIAKEGGDPEAMTYDEDYITALEYGLPPTAGVGMGIDRLMMLLANVTSIRDVILFPLLRPVEKSE